MITTMPIVTHALVGGGVYVSTYAQFRKEVLNNCKLISISANLDAKQCLTLAARLLEDLDIP